MTLSPRHAADVSAVVQRCVSASSRISIYLLSLLLSPFCHDGLIDQQRRKESVFRYPIDNNDADVSWPFSPPTHAFDPAVPLLEIALQL